MFINIFCIASSIYYANISVFKEAENEKNWTLYHIESIFLIDFISQFLRQFKRKLKAGGYVVVKDKTCIAENYLKNEFFWDFTPLLPL